MFDLRTNGSNSGMAKFDYTLRTIVEDLTLARTFGGAGTGKALSKTMVGSAGADVLVGKQENDALAGGAGANPLTEEPARHVSVHCA